ncbi:MAG: cellulase family glycosylhydrolase [Planctomycetota bacterium]
MQRLTLALMLIFSAPAILISTELSRECVSGGTLVAPDGRPLRGATFFVDLYGVPDMRDNEAKYREYFRSIFDAHDLNCVRIGPWMGVWQYDINGNEQHRAEYLYAIDTVVDWCEQSGVYAIVNLHTQHNTEVDLEKAKAFWSVIAPRYKDRSHVIYEPSNEPEPESSLKHMPAIHAHVKSLDPATHQIMYSHVAATQLKVDELHAATMDVDFTNASIGFHCYDNVLMNTIQWDLDEYRPSLLS